MAAKNQRRDQFPRLKRQAEIEKADGWANLLTGLGTNRDKSSGGLFIPEARLDDMTLASLWMGEGLATTIVKCIADDMVRPWLEIPQDPENILEGELERLKAQTEIQNALYWSRLYGGGMVLMGINDGRELDEPLNPRAIRSIDYLKHFPRTRARILWSDIVKDPKSPYFEELEFYYLRNLYGTEFKVHRSRLLIFKGESTPGDMFINDMVARYWGIASVQQAWESIKTLGESHKSIKNLIDELSIGVFKFSGLAEMLAQDNNKAFYNRMQAMSASKSSINSVIIDETEDFSRVSASLTGAHEILQELSLIHI